MVRRKREAVYLADTDGAAATSAAARHRGGDSAMPGLDASVTAPCEPDRVKILLTTTTLGRTGVEMEKR